MKKLDKVKGFLTNLGKYAEGELVGKWVTFPMDEEDFDAALKSIGVDGKNYEEWFFTDWDPEIGLGEHVSLDEVNEIAEFLEEKSEEEKEVLLKLMEKGLDFKELAKKDLRHLGNMADKSGGVVRFRNVGEVIADDFEEISGSIVDYLKKDDSIDNFFDFESFGRDLRLNYSPDEDMPETAAEFYCGDENASDADIGESYMRDIGWDWDSLGDSLEFYIDREAFGNMLFNSGEYVEMPNGDIWELF